MPLVWASHLAGTPLPERVAGSTLVERLSGGRGPGGRPLHHRRRRAGTSPSEPGSPWPPGTPACGSSGRSRRTSASSRTRPRWPTSWPKVRDSGAGLVLVGLGFPKQERLAEEPVAPAEVWVLGLRWRRRDGGRRRQAARPTGPSGSGSSGSCGCSRNPAGSRTVILWMTSRLLCSCSARACGGACPGAEGLRSGRTADTRSVRESAGESVPCPTRVRPEGVLVHVPW